LPIARGWCGYSRGGDRDGSSDGVVAHLQNEADEARVAWRVARENAAVARWLPPGGRGAPMVTAMSSWPEPTWRGPRRCSP
jgi:hypothetical protein